LEITFENSVTVAVDIESYQREYGETVRFAEDIEGIGEFLRESIEYNLKEFVTRWPYINRIEVK
jgi:hypothetical protein